MIGNLCQYQIKNNVYYYCYFVFKNKYNTPIIVHNTILSNKIVSNIYGSSDDKSDIEIDTEVIETITNKKIYKNKYSSVQSTEEY